ncbi:hypothetical protein [Actinacidiphila acidipaludis]|uniref:Uncharacterized protein n=1 Tax=Actinacidiphila acidipaludis TaxID=2873382 RepID=A0ABS7Q9D5_9ACTN|nr:hypothetical protein [Streptomyces acidipaludis]MBY8879770.1 hypothetical protein [Streptomyces acidipaludis]
MRERIDLGAAAVRLAAHRTRWLDAGLTVGPVDWQNADGQWSQEAPAVPRRIMVETFKPGWTVSAFVTVDTAGRARAGFASVTEQWWERGRHLRSLDDWETLLDHTVARAPGVRLQPAQLVARTCTTGWSDWIHGTLWITADSLVRIRSGLATTLLQSYEAGTSARKAGRPLCYAPAELLAAHPTNRVIPVSAIARASFRRGLTTTSFTLDLTTGARHRLLWRSTEPAQRLLTDRLLPLLGRRLSA